MNKKKTAALGMFTRIVGSQGFVSVLSVLIAFAIGAILIAATGASVTDAYYAMFRGAIVDPQASTFMRAIKPLTDSVFFGIPLIISGLGLAFGFRAGLFNIGGKGQMIVGALAAVWVGFSMSLPPVVHTFVAVAAAIIAGAAYAGIAGVLKAKTGKSSSRSCSTRLRSWGWDTSCRSRRGSGPVQTSRSLLTWLKRLPSRSSSMGRSSCTVASSLRLLRW